MSPVRPRRRRSRFALSLADEITLSVGPVPRVVLDGADEERLARLFVAHRGRYGPESAGVRHFVDGEPWPGLEPVDRRASSGLPGA